MKGSIGHAFAVCIHTENQIQGSISPFGLLKVSVLHELPLGRLRYRLADVPPQPNSPPGGFCPNVTLRERSAAMEMVVFEHK